MSDYRVCGERWNPPGVLVLKFSEGTAGQWLGVYLDFLEGLVPAVFYGSCSERFFDESCSSFPHSS